MRRILSAAVFALLRIGIVGFWLMTAAYGAVCTSPFAFDMFVRPQLMTGLTSFVAWHHVWHIPVYLASVFLVWPHTKGLPNNVSLQAWLARGYVVIFGMIAVALVVRPHLPTLWNDSNLTTSLLALIAPLWLASIECVAFARHWCGRRDSGTDRLLKAWLSTAFVLWIAHVVHLSYWAPAGDIADSLHVLTSLGTSWLISVSVVTSLIVLLSAISDILRLSILFEAGLFALAGCAWSSYFLARYVFATVQIEGVSALVLGFGVSLVLTATWLATALRRSERAPSQICSGTELLLLVPSSRLVAGVLVVLLPTLSLIATTHVATIDWMASLERIILNIEWSATLVCMHAVVGRAQGRATSTRRGASVAMALGLAMMIAGATTSVFDPRDEQGAVAVAQATEKDPAFRFAHSLTVRGANQNASYYRHVQQMGAPEARPTIPSVAWPEAPSGRPGKKPDIYLFVIDSLRRDYLAPYNPAVDFTPNIQAFADESYAFQNAFTRHGGTALALPSIWAGRFLVRGTRAPGFERMNLLEHILRSSQYRIAINDFTVAELLKEPVTVIDSGVPSVDTDFCSNLTGLSNYYDATRQDQRPVFGFLAPMNLHILNTRREAHGIGSEGSGHTFYEPYAARLRRIDKCFGTFITSLKQRGTYDDSVIILTSDHGDSLGERGHWGHQYWLFPEDIRVPLIVHLPASARTTMTTDLTRVAFTTDIAPSLLAVLGYRHTNLGPLAGSSLFVSNVLELTPRRRDRFLISSSYGPSLGMLTRNGRALYVTDLFERKDFAFDLHMKTIGEDGIVDSLLRSTNQQWIHDALVEVADYYKIRTMP